MLVAGRLVGFLLDAAARDNPPAPRPPSRPLACPWCASLDVHGVRPCRWRPDLDRRDADTGVWIATHPDHDWHCHACRWSAHIGDRDE